MDSKWLAFFIFVWLIGMFLGATYEKHDTGLTWAGNVQENTLQYLLNYRNMTYQQTVFGAITLPFPSPEYFATWLRIAIMDFTFLNGDMEMVRWIVLLPIAIAGIASLIYAFVQLLQGFVPFT